MRLYTASARRNARRLDVMTKAHTLGKSFSGPLQTRSGIATLRIKNLFLLVPKNRYSVNRRLRFASGTALRML